MKKWLNARNLPDPRLQPPPDPSKKSALTCEKELRRTRYKLNIPFGACSYILVAESAGPMEE
jgi:hypothetical protein